MLIVHLHNSIAFHHYSVKGKGEFSHYYCLVCALIFFCLIFVFPFTYNLFDCGI